MRKIGYKFNDLDLLLLLLSSFREIKAVTSYLFTEKSPPLLDMACMTPSTEGLGESKPHTQFSLFSYHELRWWEMQEKAIEAK